MRPGCLVWLRNSRERQNTKSSYILGMCLCVCVCAYNVMQEVNFNLRKKEERMETRKYCFFLLRLLILSDGNVPEEMERCSVVLVRTSNKVNRHNGWDLSHRIRRLCFVGICVLGKEVNSPDRLSPVEICVMSRSVSHDCSPLHQ